MLAGEPKDGAYGFLFKLPACGPCSRLRSLPISTHIRMIHAARGFNFACSRNVRTRAPSQTPVQPRPETSDFARLLQGPRVIQLPAMRSPAMSFQHVRSRIDVCKFRYMLSMYVSMCMYPHLRFMYANVPQHPGPRKTPEQ